MDLPEGSEFRGQFVTNVGLITTRGKKGDNIMTAAWTDIHSYSPWILSVSIGEEKISQKNVIENGEFGISIAADDQNVISSIAGASHGEQVNKISVLKELGYEFFRGKKAKVLLVKGATLNVECKLIKKVKTGDHTVFFGEVVEAYTSPGKEPLIFKGGKYWKFGEKIQKPGEEELKRINSIIEKHKK